MTSTAANSTFESITIKNGALADLVPFLSPWQERCSGVCLISSSSVNTRYGELVEQQLRVLGFPLTTLTIPEGESHKTLETAEQCWQRMQKAHVDRRGLVIAFGGGLITDVAGFVASNYMRGLDLVNIPTTLLGMCDAAIGGKNGVNLGKVKNCIGSFHQPNRIIIDPECLQSLPRQHLRSGLAEVIKYGVISDLALFEYLEEHMDAIVSLDMRHLEEVISWSCRIKASIVERDLQDHGVRSSLNWGHTFAHAIEGLTNYCGYLHGEAVAIGMSCAAQLSLSLGFGSEDLLNRQDALCHRAGLPTALPDLPIEDLVEQMTADKKATGKAISCIIAKGFGDVMKLDNIAKQIISESLLAKRQRDNLSPVKSPKDSNVAEAAEV